MVQSSWCKEGGGNVAELTCQQDTKHPRLEEIKALTIRQKIPSISHVTGKITSKLFYGACENQ